MDAHSLRVLEFERVIKMLAECTSCSLGHEFALQLEPLPYPETVLRRLQETREARLLRDQSGGIPLGGIYDLRETLERARVGTRLAGIELVHTRYTVEAARRMRQHLLNRRDRAPVLAEMGSNLPAPPLLESRVDSALTETGEVKDGASPELARVRSSRKQVQARLSDRMQSIIASEQYKTFIQDSVITLREGRYCIPVKAEYARAFGGLVHDSSSSGATVFMEPAAVVELGNELKQLAIREEQEIDRILRELSAIVASHYTDLVKMLSILGHMDVIHAKAVLAEKMQANEPSLNRKGIIRLFEARHPLLGDHVVPISIEVGDRFTTLLITGPNTGGKTVTLKTMGLLTLMTLAGMQIPASRDSEIAIVEQIWADIGDEQDIRQSLSTFSAHMTNIVRIMRELSSNALVLMDEIGAGTDPAEGAALARAILDRFLEQHTRVVATTHYGELKEYAYSRQGVENSSVEFNRETLAPTYRVLLGVPGSSNALYIAGRLGLDKQLIENARGHISHRELETGKLLEQIEASRRRTAQAEREAHKARSAATRARDEYEQRVNQIAEVQRTVKQQAQDEAREIVRRTAARADNILQELQKINKGSRKGPSVKQRLNNLQSDAVRSLTPVQEAQEEALPFDASHVFKKGDRVRVTSLNLDGSLTDDPKDGTVAIQIGSMRATLPLNQLRPLRSSEINDEAKGGPVSGRKTGASEIALRKAMQISPELMLRALRAEEAQMMLDKYLDDAYTAGLKQARIIHGKGTGALRRIVHEALNNHPAVEDYAIAAERDGGDGATVVKFRE